MKARVPFMERPVVIIPVHIINLLALLFNVARALLLPPVGSWTRFAIVIGTATLIAGIFELAVHYRRARITRVRS